ncbi:MAG TPA: hemerythrin domain-containing protein [Thermodesulfobacteriota bacterium]
MKKKVDSFSARRDFLKKTGILVAGASLIYPKSIFADTKSTQPATQKTEAREEEIPPTEDLMREHAVLNRILLIYDEIILRLRTGKDFSPQTLKLAAETIRNFIEDYHERLEEDYLFPRFKKAGKLDELVEVLLQQHQAGRQLTAYIKDHATLAVLKNPSDREKLEEHIRLFIRMYRPHEAREDTVLFPALRSIVSPNEFDSLGEEFEKKEQKLFGQDGFEKIVAKVANLEKTLGIYDLSQFTPKL